MPSAARRVTGARLPGHAFAALTVCATVAASASPALADPEPIHFAYHATDGCPTEEVFVALVLARSAGVRVAGPSEPARTFEVTVDAGPPSSGSVAIYTDDGFGQPRIMSADSCDDLADALALVVALAIAPSTPVPAPVPVPARFPASASAPTPMPARDSAAPALRARPHLFAGADMAFVYGAAPSPLVGGSPYVGWTAGVAGLVEPSLRLALLRASSDIEGAPSAAFAWTAGRLDGCPVAFRGYHDALILRACARVEVGALSVQPGGVAVPESRVRPWFALGPLARVEWSLIGPLFVDVEAALMLRPTNDRFFFLPDTTLSQVPVVATTEGLGIGAHLP